MVSPFPHAIRSHIQPDNPSGNLFVNGELAVDLSTDPQGGELFFGVGTKEVRGVVRGLEAGNEYDIEIRTSNSHLVAKGSPFNSRGGIRLGAMRQIKEEDAIKDAVELAEKSDGECYRLCVQLLFTNV